SSRQIGFGNRVGLRELYAFLKFLQCLWVTFFVLICQPKDPVCQKKVGVQLECAAAVWYCMLVITGHHVMPAHMLVHDGISWSKFQSALGLRQRLLCSPKGREFVGVPVVCRIVSGIQIDRGLELL